MKKVLTEKEKKELIKNYDLKTFTKFTQYRSEYFDRLYVVSGEIEKLKNDKLVALVEKNFEASFFEVKEKEGSLKVTNDLLFPKQWGLYNQEQTVVVPNTELGPYVFKAEKGVDIDWKDSIFDIESRLVKTPVVAVVDMGIDLDHEELKDSLYRNEAECNSEGKPFTDKIDRDGNKFPSDCFGWDFAAIDETLANYPLDDKGHGTHVAGIIASKKNNELGISGVSDKIKILPVRVTGSVDESSDQNKILMRAPSQRIANGILYAVYRGVDVINLSLGWPKSMDTNFMRNAILEATRHNIIVVAASGNNNTNANIFPCSYYDVICVGSVDPDGKMSNFSNYGGEVDVLAPGNQILSTIPKAFIPLKMNIQGYDIMSGTSQAAPFVSAIAALHKGTTPKATREEISRKIFDSAMKKKDQKKSLHGLVQLGKSFEIKESTSVKPIFKNLSEIVFSNEGKFSFPLNLKNYGLKANNIEVYVRFENESITLKKNSFTLDELIPIRPTSILIEGEILDQTIDHNQTFEVTIVDGDKVETFYQELFFANNILTKEKITTSNVIFQNEALPLLSYDKETGRFFDNTRTIDSQFLKNDVKDLYLRYADKSGIKLFFFKHEQNSYIEAKNTYSSESATKVISVIKGDFNYDGKPDYEIQTLVYPKGKPGFIRYAYLDSEFNPLYLGFDSINYTPQYAQASQDSQGFMRKTLPSGEKLAVRYFISEGQIPKRDQVHGPFEKDDFSSKNRIYYLDPIVTSDGVSFETRALSNQIFDIKVKDLFNQKRGEENLISFLTQSKNEYYSSTLNALYSFGLGFKRENFKVTILEDSYSLEKVSLPQKLDTYTKHKVYDLEKNEYSDSFNHFVGFLTTSNVQTLLYGDSEQKIENFVETSYENRLISFVSLFKKGNETFSLFESIDSLLLVSNNKKMRKKTKNFSFLPGKLMSEVYFPLSVKKEGEYLPGVYVDSTLLSGNMIYISTVVGDEFISPMGLSSFVPNNCVPKNPSFNREGSFINLLCQTKDGFEVKSVEVEI